jgi:hypothetical protein
MNRFNTGFQHVRGIIQRTVKHKIRKDTQIKFCDVMDGHVIIIVYFSILFYRLMILFAWAVLKVQLVFVDCWCATLSLYKCHFYNLFLIVTSTTSF